MTGKTRTDPNNRWALVLAGGDGTRLQNFIRKIAGAPIPKQYCRLLGDRSLLEATLGRVRSFAPRERTAVVLNRNHIDIGRDQIHFLPAENILVQPSNRDTGPGLLFALLHLARRDPHAIVAVFPSDHYVRNEAAFMDAVGRASHLLACFPEKVVVLGVHPDRPDPGFGYVMPGEPVDPAEWDDAFHVHCFQEKPAPKTAAMLIAAGGLWNSFVMVYRVATMLQLLERLMPAEVVEMRRAVHNTPGAIANTYAALSPWNFSSRLLAQIPEHLLVLRVKDVGWSDWGTPESIRRTILTFASPPRWFAAD